VNEGMKEMRKGGTEKGGREEGAMNE